MTNQPELTRRSFIKGAAVMAAMIPLGSLLSACAPTEENASSAESGEAASTILVAYYSAQGHTEAVAQTLIDELGADSFVITPAQPYTREDLNYNDESSRVSTEHLDENRHTELETITPDNFDSYETILIGYPIWWQEATWVINDFVSENDFSDKTVIPFCTSASSPLGESGTLLEELAGTGNWQEGMRFRSSVEEDEVREWAQGLGL